MKECTNKRGTTSPLYPSNFLIEQNSLVSSENKQLCAVIVPVGVQIQVIYENFVLERIYGCDGLCLEFTDLLFSHLPRFVESEYLHSSCNGDFELLGRLWMSKESLKSLNKKMLDEGHPPFETSVTAIRKLLSHKVPFSFENVLKFSPVWSTELIGELSLFAKYEEFFEAIRGDFCPIGHFSSTTDDMQCIIKSQKNTTKRNKFMRKYLSNEPSPCEIDKILMFRNNIPPTELRDCPVGKEDLMIDQIDFLSLQNEAIIEQIDIKPDRFGRLHPSITCHDDNGEILEINDLCLDEVSSNNYCENDIVGISREEVIPRISHIIRKVNDQAPSEITHTLHTEKCGVCYSPLVRRKLSLYCLNPTCCVTNLNKLRHACSPRILDLPFEIHEIERLHDIIGCPSTTPISTILTAGREDLSSVITDEFDLDRVLDTLKTRHQQLHGIGYSPEIQKIAQGRFMEALSIQGLHDRNISLMIKHLQKDRWRWNQLFDVLTTPTELRSFKIPEDNIRDIVSLARIHGDEVKAFANL